jgi:hypothetical protein
MSVGSHSSRAHCYFFRSATDTEYVPLIGTQLLADADGVVDLKVKSDQEEQIEGIE